MKMKSDCMMYEEHCWVLFKNKNKKIIILISHVFYPARVMDGIFRNSSDYKGWPKTDMELTIRLLNCFFCFPLGLHLFLCSYKQSRMKSCSEASHHQQNCCLHCNSCFDKSCWTQICWKLLQGETPCCCWSTSSKGQWLNWIAK